MNADPQVAMLIIYVIGGAVNDALLRSNSIYVGHDWCLGEFVLCREEN